MTMEKEIINLLKELEEPGAVIEETLSNLASRLAQKIQQLESAMRNGDMTVKKYERELHKNNLKEVDDAIEHAHALLKSRYGEQMKAQLNEFLWEMTALKRCMQATRSISQGRPPKVTRLYLCVEIIVAWKLIKNTDNIPGRQLDKEQEPVGEFHNFIQALLTVAGGHVANVRADELHKHILETAKELARLKEQADNPEIIDLSQYPA